jgi:hypothetical protein
MGSRGKEADVFIGGWLANEQLDLKLPATFLAQCAPRAIDHHLHERLSAARPPDNRRRTGPGRRYRFCRSSATRRRPGR